MNEEEIIYWTIPEFYSKPECKKIIELGLSQESGEAKVGTSDETGVNHNIRDTEVAWLEEQWLYDKLAPAIQDACINANWHIGWDWMESMQFAIYNKGQFFHWHQDNRAVYAREHEQTRNENWVGKSRKVTGQVHLNDDYEGGELQIWQPTWFEGDELPKGVVHYPGKKRGVAPVGALTVFRSDFWHRVTPVITGTRYSLVVWCLGKP
jgi:PKHD-type hydroxylase